MFLKNSKYCCARADAGKIFKYSGGILSKDSAVEGGRWNEMHIIVLNIISISNHNIIFRNL